MSKLGLDGENVLTPTILLESEKPKTKTSEVGDFPSSFVPKSVNSRDIGGCDLRIYCTLPKGNNKCVTDTARVVDTGSYRTGHTGNGKTPTKQLKLSIS